MKRQLKGIALILTGIQLSIFSLIQLPWFPIVTPLAEELLPVFAVAFSAAGLALVFGNTDD